MMNVRRASPNESELLTQIAIESESYWGEDEEFIRRFSIEYRVSETFIKNNPTYVLEDDSEIVGFYAITQNNNITELEYLYIKRSMIGKGCGKFLWMHIIKKCEELGVTRIELVTSPEALDFYKRQGAKQIGVVESTLRNGRMIPKLEYQINLKK